MNSTPVSSWPTQAESAALRERAAGLPAVALSPRDLACIESILDGYLPATAEFMPRVQTGADDTVALKDPEGALCALLAKGRLQGVEKPRHPLYERFRLQPAATRAGMQEHGVEAWILVPLRGILPRDDWEQLRQQAAGLNAGLLLLVTDGLDRERTGDLRRRMAMALAVNAELGEKSCRILICPDVADGDAAIAQAMDAQIAVRLGCAHLASAGPAPGAMTPPGVQILNLASDADPTSAEHQYPRVLQALDALNPAPDARGFCVFLTGLSGSGKSTIARRLEARLLEGGTRPVSLLDGDIVRRHLSSELGFSKAHRDLNIRRIGYVASEIVKHRGIAICAPIAPYAGTRAAVRAMIEAHGAFIEIHVATPIDVCEARDRKGLYAQARAGLIPEFTGVSDPYEEPQLPQLRLDTSKITCEDCVDQIIESLGGLGLWQVRFD